MRIPNDVHIDDKNLEYLYNTRFKLNPFERFLVEQRYNRAVAKKLKSDYEKVKTRDC